MPVYSRIFLAFITVLFFAGLYSCKKDKYEFGKGEALKNGEKWEAAGRAKYKTKGTFSSDTVQLGFTTFSKQGYERDGLTFFAIPLCLGDVTILKDEKTRTISSASLSLSLDDGHVAGDRYDVIEGHPLNHFELTELNSETGFVKGNFQLAMVVDTSLGGKRVATSPDTIFFTNGKFAVYIDE